MSDRHPLNTGIDLLFPIHQGVSLSSILGYQVMSAFCTAQPDLHTLSWGLIISRRHVGIRIDPAQIAIAAQLAGHRFPVGKHHIQLGTAIVQPLTRSRHLYAPFVSVKGFTAPETLTDCLIERLRNQAIAATFILGDRRALDISGSKVIGWECTAIADTEADAIQLQLQGLGGRYRMGGGVFVAAKTTAQPSPYLANGTPHDHRAPSAGIRRLRPMDTGDRLPDPIRPT